jgi:hypothetical protein
MALLRRRVGVGPELPDRTAPQKLHFTLRPKGPTLQVAVRCNNAMNQQAER